MQVNTGALKHFFEGLHMDGKELRSWMEKTLKKEKMAEIMLFASTATVLGYVVWFVARAADNYRIIGIG